MNKGFTVLEIVVSSAIFLMITISAANLLLFSSTAGTQIAVKQELLENSRAAMDFLISYIRAADKIVLITESSSTLKELRATQNVGESAEHTYVFRYDSRLNTASPRYHRLEFGGNELASYVKDIKIKIDQELMLLTITIITDDGLEEGVRVPAQVYVGQTGLRYKNFKIE